MMELILFPAAVAAIVFIAFLLLMPRRISSDEERRKKVVLDQMSQETERRILQNPTDVSLLKDQGSLVPGGGVLGNFPGVQSTFDLLLKSGMAEKSGVFLLGAFLLFVLLALLLSKLGILGIIFAFAIAFFAPRQYLKHLISKRNEDFINLFPDAVDMIVRSVKSGHPLNTAMRLIADNMDPPLRDEFKQVVDEISYGRTLGDALLRLSRRIDEPDLNFFVVVLSVQQETGGSLAEVLSNLSGIIRKRRQLRLKIRALTAEGRATSYVLGSLPIVELGAIYWIAPNYLEPLWGNLIGTIILGTAAALIVAAIWIVRIMINIDV